ncbi:hypothetical protein HA402_010588 [Bradysia odoriphaga]|nr:hypothetical protein HA402_010588 [Bradysia odoriphaga]
MAQFIYQSQPQTNSSDDEDENNSDKFISCDTIRRKITLFLATKEMTQTAFLSAIGGVNSNSLGRFMKLKGPFRGRDNGTYEGARKFFDRREKKRKADAIKAKEQKKSENKAAKSGLKKRPIPSSEENATDVVEPAKKIVVRDIELPENLPVFDDCDVIRTKIGQCFHKKELTQAGFAKAIGLTPAAVSRFLSKKGFNQGAGSDVYPNAYRYFEKQRLQRGEGKSKHRLKSEIDYPNGYPLMNPPTHMWICKSKN